MPLQRWLRCSKLSGKNHFLRLLLKFEKFSEFSFGPENEKSLWGCLIVLVKSCNSPASSFYKWARNNTVPIVGLLATDVKFDMETINFSHCLSDGQIQPGSAHGTGPSVWCLCCTCGIIHIWLIFTCSLSGMLILCIWLQISIIHHSNLSEPISSLFSRVFASNRNFHFYSPLTKLRITLILHSRITSFSFGVFPNIRIYVRSITDNESLNFCVRWRKFTSPDLALIRLWMNLSFLTEIKVSKLQVRMLGWCWCVACHRSVHGPGTTTQLFPGWRVREGGPGRGGLTGGAGRAGSGGRLASRTPRLPILHTAHCRSWAATSHVLLSADRATAHIVHGVFCYLICGFFIIYKQIGSAAEFLREDLLVEPP